MNREEAIKRLKEVRTTIQPFRYVDEAIDYAIKALEQEPCDKCEVLYCKHESEVEVSNATDQAPTH